jgi:hypothetical protein
MKLNILNASVLMMVLSGSAIAAPEADPALGEAVLNNMQVQIIPPKPPGLTRPGDSGQRAVTAVARYQFDKVKPLLKNTEKGTVVGAQGGVVDSTVDAPPLLENGGSNTSGGSGGASKPRG